MRRRGRNLSTVFALCDSVRRPWTCAACTGRCWVDSCGVSVPGWGEGEQVIGRRGAWRRCDRGWVMGMGMRGGGAGDDGVGDG